MQEFSKRSGVSSFVVVALLVLVIVASGVGWWYMDQKSRNEKASLQDQVDSLRAEVSKLQGKSEGSTDQTNTDETASDPTAGWKTYSNSKYGFYFKYPSTYSQTVASSYAADDGVYIDSTSSGGYEQPHLLSVEAEASEMTLSAYLAKATADGVFNDARKITFAGQTAYEGVDAGMTTNYGILVKKGSYIYHIVLSATAADALDGLKAALSDEQEQILATFQFSE